MFDGFIAVYRFPERFCKTAEASVAWSPHLHIRIEAPFRSYSDQDDAWTGPAGRIGDAAFMLPGSINGCYTLWPEVHGHPTVPLAAGMIVEVR
jgi:hypothetical protein